MEGLRIVYDSPFTAARLQGTEPLSLSIISNLKAGRYELDPLATHTLFVAGTSVEDTLNGINTELKSGKKIVILDCFNAEEKTSALTKELIEMTIFQKLAGLVLPNPGFSDLIEKLDSTRVLVLEDTVINRQKLLEGLLEDYLVCSVYRGIFRPTLMKILELTATGQTSRNRAIKLFTKNSLRPSLEKILTGFSGINFGGTEGIQTVECIKIDKLGIEDPDLKCTVSVSIKIYIR